METSVEDLLARFKNGEIGLFLISKFEADVEQEIRFLWEWGIDRISDDSIRQAVKYYYLHKVPDQFFSAPSSTSGKHPYWHNVPGGLVRHLTECCISADRLLGIFGFVEDDDRTIHVPSRDIVLAATVITDTQKNGIPWGNSSVRNHGEIAANTWRDIAESCKLSKDIADQISEAVHYHYGRYTQVPDGQPRKRFNDLPDFVKIVHLLDVCSSNRDNEFIYRPVDRIPSPVEVLN